MTRRRKRRRHLRRYERTMIWMGIATVALVFIGLNDPAIRASVNATLIWLVVRGLIGALVVLGVAWTYQFTKPPKVKRQTYKKHPLGRKNTVPTAAPTGTTGKTSPKHANQINPTPPINPTVQMDDLLVPMSGAHRMFTGDDDDDI